MKLHLNKLSLTRWFAIALILVGLAGLIPINYFALRDKLAVAEQGSIVPVKAALKPAPNLITGTPVAITIPSLNISLQVVPGNYNPRTGQWNLSLYQAQFAEPSVPPNNLGGNTLIYGHYRPEVFAYLHLIKPGALATITTSNGYQFSYTYQTSQAFDPTDTSIFTYQGAPRLTIQTCSGAFFQHRQMYYFVYDGYAKI